MKKNFLLLVFMSLFLISGCTVDYANVITVNPSVDDPSENQDEEKQEEPLSEPYLPVLEIDESLFFYPSTLTISSNIITSYSYIDENLTASYKIYSAYYSEYYDTIYIAYDSVTNPIQSLKAKDLYEIEMHAINYFKSDTSRSEDKNYLKAVRIYPDRLASSCRKNRTDDVANRINGCADYGGQEAIIDLNNTTSLDSFYNPERVYKTPLTYVEYEPMRDTFAHEYGHVSTFYHMVYKNDGDYEDYLKLRLSSLYDTVYPSGLPLVYSSSDDYTIQPEEILADDFVELFYDTSNKKANDTYEYTLLYNDYRNSLSSYSTISILKNNGTLFNQIKEYYTTNFLNYSNKKTYEKPIVISSSNKNISYYESYSKIGDPTNLKTIVSPFTVNLIAVGEVTIDGMKYFRVILSNTTKVTNGAYNQKDVGKMFGYVLASSYTFNSSIKVYKLDKGGASVLTKNSLIPIENNTTNNLYILPFYDFSYVLNTTSDNNYATMYDYLASDLTSKTYKVNIYSFGTLIQ